MPQQHEQAALVAQGQNEAQPQRDAGQPNPPGTAAAQSHERQENRADSGIIGGGPVLVLLLDDLLPGRRLEKWHEKIGPAAGRHGPGGIAKLIAAVGMKAQINEGQNLRGGESQGQANHRKKPARQNQTRQHIIFAYGEGGQREQEKPCQKDGFRSASQDLQSGGQRGINYSPPAMLTGFLDQPNYPVGQFCAVHKIHTSGKVAVIVIVCSDGKTLTPR